MLLIQRPPALPNFQFFSPNPFNTPSKARQRFGARHFQFPNKPSVQQVRSDVKSEEKNLTPPVRESTKTEGSSRKRKRGYYPYTEDTDYVSSEDLHSDVPTSSQAMPKRLFVNYIPWYRWGKQSFVLPEEKVRGYSAPDSISDTDEDIDEPLDSVDSVKEAELMTPEPVLERKSPKSETRQVVVCPTCSNTKDPSVIKEAQKLKRIRPSSGFEKLILDGLVWIWDCATWLKATYNELIGREIFLFCN